MSEVEIEDDVRDDGDRYWSWRLPDGGTLVLSVVTLDCWTHNAEAQHLGDDFGYFLYRYSVNWRNEVPEIIAKFATIEAVYDFADLLTGLLPAVGS